MKYFKDVRARGTSCTSSNTMRVFAGWMGTPASRDRAGIRRDGVMSPAKSRAMRSLLSKEM